MGPGHVPLAPGWPFQEAESLFPFCHSSTLYGIVRGGFLIPGAINTEECARQKEEALVPPQSSTQVIFTSPSIKEQLPIQNYDLRRRTGLLSKTYDQQRMLFTAKNIKKYGVPPNMKTPEA
ncbi:hypothetical protein JTE90_014636 [Oedothorax gibbosus]|uniref:Uncharacterized protein n=1 Tax=Oedothorax gibbosus TaxID=931172 RepID=A0AAV6VA86_9ARAC|nr:hypothetical protein JTE90_014636 [Oedothorax gibbosus]